MNIYKSLIFISLFFLSLSSSAQTLWGKALAGDTLLNIKNKYPDIESKGKPVYGRGEESHEFELKYILVNNEYFSAFFIFSARHGLNSVILKPTKSFTGKDCDAIYINAVSALSAKYGSKINPGFGWEINGVKIAVSQDPSAHIGVGDCVKISYSSTKINNNISTNNL